MYDAVIIGSGPNGLSAAITLQRQQLQTLIIEGQDIPGGGVRTAELTLPGFKHDVCSAIHPLAVSSPFFKELPLTDFGLQWITPPVALAHPLHRQSAGVLFNTLENTVQELGADGENYRQLMEEFLKGWDSLGNDILGPLRFPKKIWPFLHFGLKAIQPAKFLARNQFITEKGQALFAGLAGHSMLPLSKAGSSAIALVLGILAHVSGWSFPKGGAQKITDALVSYYQSLGGHLKTKQWIHTLDELPEARVYVFDTSPTQLVQIAGKHLPERYKKRLMKFRYGSGVYKMDFALSGAIPWKSLLCHDTATVHLGGSLEEIALAEEMVHKGKHPENPFVILAQPSLFDEMRAPAKKHTCWAYCHVPRYSDYSMAENIENRIEEFAPGFKDLILAKHVMNCHQFETYNPNYKGGDINGGMQNLLQTFTRPVFRLDPYSTPNPSIFLCSASTPPGGGVHGMCGFHAAQSVLKKVFGRNKFTQQ